MQKETDFRAPAGEMLIHGVLGRSQGPGVTSTSGESYRQAERGTHWHGSAAYSHLESSRSLSCESQDLIEAVLNKRARDPVEMQRKRRNQQRGFKTTAPFLFPAVIFDEVSPIFEFVFNSTGNPLCRVQTLGCFPPPGGEICL